MAKTQPRQSLGPGAAEPRRSSVASRRSSAFGVRGIADPRPIGEKDYMNQSIHNLVHTFSSSHAKSICTGKLDACARLYTSCHTTLQIDYLLNNGYDQRMDFAANKGWRPTGRDFQNISCFLFKQVDPNWQCGAKFEDEVRSGAPFPVTLKIAQIFESPCSVFRMCRCQG